MRRNAVRTAVGIASVSGVIAAFTAFLPPETALAGERKKHAGRDAKMAGRSRLGAGARRTQAGRCSGTCRCCVRARCTACRYQEVNLERVIRITAHRTRCAVFIAGGNRDSR